MDDLTGKINDLLSDPDSMEKIKNLAGMFAASSGNGNASSSDGNSSSDSEGERDEEDSGGGNDEFPIDPEMIFKLKSAMDLMKKDDPRVDFLLALKPNLSGERRKKVDEAIHILRLLSLMPMLRDQGIF